MQETIRLHTIIVRNLNWFEKGLLDFHAAIEIPEGNGSHGPPIS